MKISFVDGARSMPSFEPLQFTFLEIVITFLGYVSDERTISGGREDPVYLKEWLEDEWSLCFLNIDSDFITLFALVEHETADKVKQ